ncbi:hypothetical protein [Nostoc sp. NMS7]|uniref:hypothetical protein n=1 Tax=Nostoc sp. NMS7 TaxID=2815391 RepID=UPI0025FCC1A5|nr:hypothetical protein [Nostoc sp. NMS7]
MRIIIKFLPTNGRQIAMPINQQGRGKKSYYNNSSFKVHTPRMQPLTEEGKAPETWCK